MSADGIRCAQWSRTQQIDLVGTAGSHPGYVLVEWPLPWPRDAGEIEQLEPLRDAVALLGLRIQLLVPATDVDRRVVVYRRPEGCFRTFEGRELRVPLPERGRNGTTNVPTEGSTIAEALGRAGRVLLAGGGDPVAGLDVLICTHGRRDRCCGSLGTELWQQVRTAMRHQGDATFSRTSHTGGHRFAATCIVLPAGTLWGRMDVDALERVVQREGPLDDLVPRYRGCSGIDSPAGQALERAVLAEVGWPLFDHARGVEDLGGGRFRLTLSGPDSTTAWEAKVVPGRTHRLPDCGKPIGNSTTTQTERSVVGLSRVT